MATSHLRLQAARPEQGTRATETLAGSLEYTPASQPGCRVGHNSGSQLHAHRDLVTRHFYKSTLYFK